ncbi:unnamed protein product [Didymodactylos carnosus]|uniref:Tetratricopeptide repeat protein n=1 Tax=Didymodactylos carnosus TaxID=1234261 RepID=A0A815S0G2_9BILA|nr:unnamed protein product [Didymodactylos carnosus]CAF1483745.1 unnamed protein product [Didymodactylos carnosus]CAF3682369.1 unnamed protein product [Didymodactylos carnosus]CAF4348200.1 unnamed protein product [Didymodactylos carnosus]
MDRIVVVTKATDPVYAGVYVTPSRVLFIQEIISIQYFHQGASTFRHCMLIGVIMKDEQIEIINTTEDEKKLQKTVLKWLNRKEITVDDLIINRKNKTIKISSDILQQIGYCFWNGSEIPEDIEESFKLFQFLATELGSAVAFYDCADYYFAKKSFDKAATNCKLAINKGYNTYDLQILMGKIFVAKREYSEAIQHFEEAIRKLKSSSDNDAAIELGFSIAKSLCEEKRFQEAIKCLRLCVEELELAPEQSENARKIEKKCLKGQLTQLYTEINKKVDNTDENGVCKKVQQMNSSPAVDLPPGWFQISEELDGFDINACGELDAAVKIVEREEQAANAALEVARNHVKMARESKLSQSVTEALRTKLKQFKRNYEEFEKKKEMILEAYQTYGNITEKIIRRQTQTEYRFFDSHRTRNEKTFELSEALESRRLSENVLEPLKLGVEQIPPTRRLITAERSTMETSVEIFGRPSQPYDTKTGWLSNPAQRKTSPGVYSAYTQDYSFTETLTIGSSDIKYKQRTNPHCNHLGDYHMESIGSYAQIIAVLNKITGSKAEHEKQLVELMLAFSHDGKPATLQNLRAINNAVTNDNVDYKDHELPLATVQARALQLMKNGYLKIEEVFSENAPYGVFTGKEIGKNMDNLREKIIRINDLYHKAILEQRSSNRFPYIELWKTHSSVKTLATRKELHRELRETFGGESDTDGEGYESNDEKETLSNKIKF